MGYRLPFVTTIAIFLLLIAGALVVGFDAGLACSDWPLCNGHIIPPLEGKIIIEYTHRMLSTGVGLLVLANLYAGWRKRKESPIAMKLVILSFVLLMMAAVLGGINVLEKLPPGFTTMDTSVATLLFATFVALTGVTLAHHRRKQGAFHQNKQIQSLFKPTLIATIAVYAEFVLGAFIKHSDAGAVWVKGEVTLLNEVISTPQIAAALMYVHVFATALVVIITVWLFFHARLRKALTGQALVLAALLVLQVAAGYLTMAMKLAVISDVIHLALGVLMMASCVFMMVQAKLGVDLLDCDNQKESVVRGNVAVKNLS
ncbi:cytochrome c oxidase assembly protein subunit 15 [Aneurinibacillus thermoaerophilus]|uniref:Cytochrome c oxidase assembly protein subunit 15 n=1 Tax=Aneurinibacillus thermoaerophilus TaxID=143495 RepID=A0A1G8CFX4_ANETH|nr:COX15/CtaA family protein [Aneurinibacillus thermoaerophilus]SDH44351.1 cytochrome c oxidase assembly protein subunit 15 [Aneurinibacillus thermoaerophilus]